MAIEYSTDSQVYSLMKLIIYFNPEKIEEYKTIIENILSHFKFFDFLKIYDPKKTLTLKSFYQISLEKSEIETAFYSLRKINEHLINIKAPIKLLERFMKRENFYSYSLNKKRFAKIMRFVSLTYLFIRKYNLIDIKIPIKVYTNLRENLLKLTEALKLRNKEKGIKTKKNLKDYLKKKFEIFRNSKKVVKNFYINSKLKRNKKQYKDDNKSKFNSQRKIKARGNLKFVDLSSIDVSIKDTEKVKEKLIDVGDKDKEREKQNKKNKIKEIKLGYKFIMKPTEISIRKNTNMLNRILMRINLNIKKAKENIFKNKDKNKNKNKKKNKNKNKNKKNNINNKKSAKEKIKILKRLKNFENYENKKKNDKNKTVKPLFSSSKLKIFNYNENFKLKKVFYETLDLNKSINKLKRLFLFKKNKNLIIIKNKYLDLLIKIEKIKNLINSLSDKNSKMKINKSINNTKKYIQERLRNISQKSNKNHLYKNKYGKDNKNKNDIKNKTARTKKSLLEDFDYFSHGYKNIPNENYAEKFGNYYSNKLNIII